MHLTRNMEKAEEFGERKILDGLCTLWKGKFSMQWNMQEQEAQVFLLSLSLPFTYNMFIYYSC